MALTTTSADTYVATLKGARDQNYAKDHFSWLLNGQRGEQPACPHGLDDTTACTIRTALNQIYAAG